MATTKTNSAAKTVTLNVITENTREIKGSSANTVALTDDIFEKMSYANQLLISLHETYIGEVTEVIKYTNGFGIPQATLEAVATKLGLA